MIKTLIEQSIKEYKKQETTHTLFSPESVFDVLFKKIQDYHETPAHSITELRMYKTTKSKGDLFEEFCKLYLLHILEYDNVWLLGEVPEEEKRKLKMPFGDKDYGIDIICKKNDIYTAVQCKFKTPKPPVKVLNKKGETKIIFPCVGWKELTTFNELCNTTGPWSERIVMTTAKSVRRMGGRKIKGDKSICIGTFKGLTDKELEKIIKKGDEKREEKKEEEKVEEKVEHKLSVEELRKKRLEYFSKLH